MSGGIKDDLRRFAEPSRLDLGGKFHNPHLSDKYLKGLEDKFPLVQKFDVKLDDKVLQALVGTELDKKGNVGESDFKWVWDGKRMHWLMK